MWPRCSFLLLATLLLSSPAVLAASAPWVGQTLDGVSCRDFGGEGGYGPYDYTNPQHRERHLEVVERYHFTAEVRTLRGGANRALPLNDLDYTLRAFPNHHQAMYALIRYATSPGYAAEAKRAWQQVRNSGSPFPPPECYLQRAMAFTPEDGRLHLLAGIYYHRVSEPDKARRAYEQAVTLAPESPEAHYNLGLFLVDRGEYREAREHARTAYELGYPLPGLRNQLAEAGHPLQE